MKKLLFALAFLCAAPSALAQQPSVQVDRSGVTIQSAQAVSITYGDGYVRISWTPSPMPPGPVPPGPVNPPGPVDPKPVDPPKPPAPPVNPAPIDAPGLRVLMVYDTNTLASMPVPQLQVLYDQGLRDFLTSAVAKNEKGMPEWRVYDKSTDLTNESEIWKKAMARPKPQIPWILISNGKTGTEEPLPATVDAARTLIQKYMETK